ncbi:MAG: DUF4411 family protein, partial [Myxococcales bacterium]|nr:DUF4411 family protein [Myxococcales bacterium]
MVYVLDTSSFIHIGHFFPDRFPTFWDQFDELVEDGRVISVREARSELETQAAAEHLFEWVQRNREIFHTPSADEASFVAEVFAVPRFLELIKQKNISRGQPVADPFLVAAAHAIGGCAVTEEREKV